MNATKSERAILQKLQSLDSKIVKLQYKINNIPETLQIDHLLDDNTKDKLIIKHSELNDLKLVRQKIQIDKDRLESDKQKNNENLNNPSLSPRDLMFINDNIKRQVKRTQVLNKKLEQINYQISEKETELNELDKLIVNNSKRIDTLKIIVKEKSTDNTNSIKKLEKEKNLLALSDPLRRIYEAHKKDGIAIASLIDGKCEGCNMVQPPVIIQKLKNLQSSELIFCEECDRILLI
jgi:predicted  nucleic acid-binding Zn-ribbon protein